MKQTAVLGTVAMVAATMLWQAPAFAQTVINNNNNVTVNSGNGNNNIDTGQAVYWRNDNRKLEAWMYTDKTNYRPGTGVQLRLTLTNFGGGDASIQLPGKGEYAITITDVRSNRVIWSRDKARSRGAALQIKAGGTVQWTEFWDQRDSRGNIVPMGAYRIDARVLDSLPVSAQIFLTERSVERPQPGNGNGGIVAPDPVTGPIPGNGNNGGGANGWGIAAIRGELVLSKTAVRPGDVVRFTYTVVNPNRQPTVLTFGSAQLFDVWATPVTRNPTASRTPVWRLSDGVAWAQMVQQVTLQPGERKVFSGSWRIGNDLKSGQTLDVSASLTPSGSTRGTIGVARTRIEVN